MAVTFIKRSTLPAPVKGKTGGTSVMIGGNGQISLSKLASDFFPGGQLLIGFDGDKLCLIRTDSKLAKGSTEADHVTLKHPKKGSGASFAASRELTLAKNYGASHAYPYKESGNQTFTPTVDETNKIMYFVLPATALAKRPVVKRVKKVVAPSVRAEAGSTKVAAEEELVLA